MRFLLLLSLWMIFLSSSAGASHLQFYSGSIEWENDSANYFTFHLYLVAGCQQLSTSTPQQLSLMVDGLPVLVNLSSNTILHDGCTPNPWSCSYSPGKFKQRLLHYTSSSYPLTFAPGQNSIEVWYSMGLGRRTSNFTRAAFQ